MITHLPLCALEVRGISLKCRRLDRLDRFRHMMRVAFMRIKLFGYFVGAFKCKCMQVASSMLSMHDSMYCRP